MALFAELTDAQWTLIISAISTGVGAIIVNAIAAVFNGLAAMRAESKAANAQAGVGRIEKQLDGVAEANDNERMAFQRAIRESIEKRKPVPASVVDDIATAKAATIAEQKAAASTASGAPPQKVIGVILEPEVPKDAPEPPK